MTETFYWVAINGASAAASSIPFPTSVEVSPVPEILLGYATRAEQLERQQFFLTKPIKEVRAYLARANRGVVMIKPKNPETPTEGQTIWASKPYAWS